MSHFLTEMKQIVRCLFSIKSQLEKANGNKKVIVHEIVVSLKIPPYKEKLFNEDDEISIDTCLLFVLFHERELRRTTILWRSKFKF